MRRTRSNKDTTVLRCTDQASSHGRIGLRSRDVESVHLLTGFARCAVCGGSFYPLSRSHGRERAFFYGCSANHKRGQAVCGNGLVMRKERIDDAVLEEIGGKVLRPAVVEAVLAGVFDAMTPEATAPTLDRARAELATVEREIARLVDALASGGDMPVLLAALKARQARQGDLQRAITEASTIRPRLDRKPVERDVRDRLARWRALLGASVADGRQFFREVLTGPIRFTPKRDATAYRFDGEIEFGRLFSGVAGLAPFVASPSPMTWNQIVTFLQAMDGLRRAGISAA